MTARFSNDPQPYDQDMADVLAAELGYAPDSSAPARRFELEDEAGSPCATYLPENYEPNYAYPLLVWLHDDGGSERDLLSIMPAISTQNYFGLSLRGPLSARNQEAGFRWLQSHEDVSDVEEDLFQHVRRLRRAYHLHTERVFIGGHGAGATLALQLGLRRPEWFAGMISIGGRTPDMDKPLAKYRLLQGKRTLLAAGADNRLADVAETLKLSTLLHSAGLTVCTRQYQADHGLPRKLLLDIDRWMMQECYRTVTVEQ